MRIVLSNCRVDEAPALARQLVGEGVAACVNLLPGVVSVYRWRGEICEEPESTLLVKVSEAGLDRLCARLRELHSYDVPEIVVLPVDVAHSDAAYVQWVRDSTA